MSSSDQESETRDQKTEPSGSGLTADLCPLTSGHRVPNRNRSLFAAAVVSLVAVAALAVWYFAIREREPTSDLERLQGEWQIAVATGREPRQTNNAIRVAGDRWEYVTVAASKAYRVKLNEAARPKEIDLELLDTTGLRGAPVKMHGVYVFEGNKTVRVRINDTTEPRPTTLDDPDANVWVLTKVKLEPDALPKK